jgi:PAS domain S-box
MSDKLQIQKLSKLISDLANGNVEEVERECLSFEKEKVDDDVLAELRGEVLNLAKKHIEAKDFIIGISSGDLNVRAPKKNRLLDPFKELQANLSHLVWQARQVADGDYSQHVDFLGEFSESFNSLIASLKEKQKIEENLKRSEEQYRKIFCNSIEGIFQSTLAGKLLMVNPAFASLFGYDSPEEMMELVNNIGDQLYLNQNDRQAIIMQLKNEGFVENLELKFIRKDGNAFWVSMNSQAVTDESDNLLYMEGTIVDISNRKKAEEAMSISSARLKRAEITSATGNWELHLDSGTIIASEGAQLVYGIDREQFDYSFIKSIPLLEYRDLLDLAMEQLIKNDIPYNVDFKIETPGEGLIKDIHSQATYDRENNIVFGVIQDITEQKKGEEALKESESKYRSLFSEMNEGFALHEVIYNEYNKAINYKILNVNSSFEKLVGKKAEEAIGALATDLYGVETAPYLDIYAKVAESGEHQMFQTYFEPFDQYFQISVFSHKSRHFATIFTDITVQRKGELALLESERRFRDMMEHVNMVSAMLDIRGNITFANEYLLRLTGWKSDEIVGRNWFDVFILPEAPIRTDLFNGVDSGDVPLHYENEILTRSGELRLIHWSNTVLRNSKGAVEGIAGVGVDITDSKKAETALLESKASLVELNATKDKFFSIIAHDLKSPFNSILGLSGLLEDQVKEKNYEGLEEFASLIRTSSELAYDLLKNLLEWSRTQTGKMEFSPEYIELVSLIGETIKLLQHNAIQKSIGIETELPRNMVVFADKAMISTVLRNLISNAIKFTPDNGQIVISATATPEEITITVADNGVGIGEREITKLFKIDENHSTLGTHNEKGTGLGLILCKEFIEKHDGRIWVESEIGIGSRFYFTIPRK